MLKMDNEFIIIDFKNRNYKIKPCFNMVQEIENEIGSVPKIIKTISGGDFKITDIVTIMHVILSVQKIDIDYKELGNEVIKKGQRILFHRFLRF